MDDIRNDMLKCITDLTAERDQLRAELSQERRQYMEAARNFREELKKERERVKHYHDALASIKKHQEVMGGSFAQMGSTWRIAAKALSAGEGGE